MFPATARLSIRSSQLAFRSSCGCQHLQDRFNGTESISDSERPTANCEQRMIQLEVTCFMRCSTFFLPPKPQLSTSSSPPPSFDSICWSLKWNRNFLLIANRRRPRDHGHVSALTKWWEMLEETSPAPKRFSTSLSASSLHVTAYSVEWVTVRDA